MFFVAFVFHYIVVVSSVKAASNNLQTVAKQWRSILEGNTSALDIPAVLSNVTANSFIVTWNITQEDCVSDQLVLFVDMGTSQLSTVCNNGSHNNSMYVQWLPYHKFDVTAYSCTDESLMVCGKQYQIQGITEAEDAKELNLEATNVVPSTNFITISWILFESNCTGPTTYWATSNDSISSHYNLSNCEFSNTTVDLNFTNIPCNTNYLIDIWVAVEGFATKLVATVETSTRNPDVPYTVYVGLANSTDTSVLLFLRTSEYTYCPKAVYEGTLTRSDDSKISSTATTITNVFTDYVFLDFTHLHAYRYYGRLDLKVCWSNNNCQDQYVDYNGFQTDVGEARQPDSQVWLRVRNINTYGLYLIWDFAYEDCYGPTKLNITYTNGYTTVIDKDPDTIYECDYDIVQPYQISIGGLQPKTEYYFTVTPYTSAGTVTPPITTTATTLPETHYCPDCPRCPYCPNCPASYAIRLDSNYGTFALVIALTVALVLHL